MEPLSMMLNTIIYWKEKQDP